MPVEVETRDLGRTPFRLGGWLVEPSLNRISRDGSTIQLELKVMDVLVCLAERAGEVVTRQQIVDQVWATEFISDNTLTHAVTELRNALSDDARNPSFIETIHRRGYRLIAPIEAAVSDEAGESKVARFPVSERLEERSPYPGLAAFTEADAEFFFGREGEVAKMWRKLTSRRLLAVIGPSGVGKSSFIRAGVIAAKPDGWGCIVCQPGEAPLKSLVRSLVPEFEGDSDAISRLVHLSRPDETAAMVSRWRDRCDHGLIVVDQFEELFTLSAWEIQEAYADVLRLLVDQADVHLLLSMRDDFLYRCQNLKPLQPVLDGLFALEPPSSANLERALVEPARKIGYTFEDNLLAQEMVEEAEGERGALPLTAFAVARLWDARDRDKKLLTRQAYQDIGGVGGSLARHAENALKSIGSERVPVVREIFRNLVTSQGTRAVREVEDVLSVFPAGRRFEAEEVLRRLIDARLLTSFEEEGVENSPRRRVEVVHESLLESWPRLVRWQTQDADAAQLRDQLRQAARTWDEHDRASDFLWTGKAYREFSVWRENYPGGLSVMEEEFATAMTGHAKRRKRLRRIAVAAAFAVLLAVLTVIGSFWKQSESEARRAEAAELVALGQLELQEYPTAAVAYAITSLERADSQAARLLALEALWKGPAAMIVNEKPAFMSRFSRDGGWLVQSFFAKGDGQLNVMGADGSSWHLPETYGHERVSPGPGNGNFVLFYRDEERGTDLIGLWSAPDRRRLGEASYKIGQLRRFSTRTFEGRMAILVSERDGRFSVDTISPEGDYERLGTREIEARKGESSWRLAMDGRTGLWVAVSTGHEIYLTEIGDQGLSEPRLLGRQPDLVTRLAVDPYGRFVASADKDGQIRLWDTSGATNPVIINGPPDIFRLDIAGDGSLFLANSVPPTFELEQWIWSLDGERPQLLRRFDLGDTSGRMVYGYLSPNGEHLVHIGAEQKIRVWPLSAPADAEPFVLLRGEVGQINMPWFNPDGSWLAVSDSSGLALWPMTRPYPAVIHGHKDSVNDVIFGPQGQWIVSSSTDGAVKLWPVGAYAPPPGKVLHDVPEEFLWGLAASPNGDRVLVGGGVFGRGGVLRYLTVENDPPRLVAEFPEQIFDVALSSDGRFAAAGRADWQPSSRNITIWDVASGEQIAELAQGDAAAYANPQFVGDGQLMALSQSGLKLWDIETGESQMLCEGGFRMYAVTADRRRALLREGLTEDHPGQAVFLDLETGTTTRLETHGDQIWSVALDADGTTVVTGDMDGTIRIGSVTGEEPHVLIGHKKAVRAVVVDPLGRWIASGSQDTSVRLWPMPDLSKPPLHTLPREELIAKLKTLTNLRVVRDEESPTGWKLTHDPFPGWETVPEW